MFSCESVNHAIDPNMDREKQFKLAKKQVGIVKEVVFIGMRDKIEIWAAEAYEVYRASREGKQEPPKARGP